MGVTDGGVNIVLRGFGFGVNYPEATLQGEEGGEEERNNLLCVVCAVCCVLLCCGVLTHLLLPLFLPLLIPPFSHSASAFW